MLLRPTRSILSIAILAIIAPSSTITTCQAAKLLSAYVGAVDVLSVLFQPVTGCNPLEGSESDGMPVTFDVSLAKESIQADQFAITTNGQVILAKCATLEPADEPGESHTVLLTGNFVFAEDDQSLDIPTMVEIIPSASTGQELLSQTGIHLTGLSTSNVRLGSRDGPELALAFWYPNLGSNGRVQVVFEGGVTTNNGGDLTDETLKHFFLLDSNGTKVNPVGFGDLGDNDNYLFLDLPSDFVGVPVSVELEAGILFDPMNYPNPLTSVNVTEGQYNFTAIGETSGGQSVNVTEGQYNTTAIDETSGGQSVNVTEGQYNTTAIDETSGGQSLTKSLTMVSSITLASFCF